MGCSSRSRSVIRSGCRCDGGRRARRKLAEDLRALGHELVDRTVLRLLKGMGFSMQGDCKTQEGEDHPDRDAQFHYINDTVAGALAAEEPVIRVDTKKKELVGDFKNGGREWARKGEPMEVNAHDFPSHARGKARRTESTTSRRTRGRVWLGSSRTPPSSRPTRSAPGGSTSGRALPRRGDPDDHRRCGWVQQPARAAVERGAWETGRPDRDPDQGVALPARARKWNRIEHRLFSFISINWRGKPLTSYQAIINLIAATTTSTGLKVYARAGRERVPNQDQGHRCRARRRQHPAPCLPR